MLEHTVSPTFPNVPWQSGAQVILKAIKPIHWWLAFLAERGHPGKIKEAQEDRLSNAQ
jgi:hypothetical protein